MFKVFRPCVISICKLWIGSNILIVSWALSGVDGLIYKTLPFYWLLLGNIAIITLLERYLQTKTPQKIKSNHLFMTCRAVNTNAKCHARNESLTFKIQYSPKTGWYRLFVFTRLTELAFHAKKNRQILRFGSRNRTRSLTTILIGVLSVLT